MKDKIDILYARKKFFRIIFPELREGEYIRILQKKDDFCKVTFWNNIDDMNNYIEKYKFSCNTYFSLSSTDKNGGTIENLKHRYCIGLDFDKKLDNSLDVKEIMFRFKKIGNLWYHGIIDSGNGYHTYICIEETNDINKVVQVTKSLGKLLGADNKAELATQILRVPLTYNSKNNKSKQVNIIHMFEKNTIKPYDIDKLYSKYCNNDYIDDRIIKYEMKNTNMPPCIENILQGVTEGERNFYLKRLISYFKLYGYNKSESSIMIKEWNNKCDPSLGEHELEYQFNYIWDKPYKCFGCKTTDITIQTQIAKYCNKNLCKNKGRNIQYENKDMVTIEYKICRKLEKIRRKSSVKLDSNEFFILSVLKNNPEGLKTSELINKITYKNKCCLSKPTINKVLNNLSDKKFISITTGIKSKKEENFYKVKCITCDNLNKINISYFAIVGVITGLISSSDLLVYTYMRYRINENLNLVESEIASLLGMTQQSLSTHIRNLIEAKYIEFKGKDFKNNKYGNNVYSLNM